MLHNIFFFVKRNLFFSTDQCSCFCFTLQRCGENSNPAKSCSTLLQPCSTMLQPCPQNTTHFGKLITLFYSHCTGDLQIALKKHKKKRPPEGNLFLILQYTTHFGKLSDSTTHFGKLSEFDKVYIINYAPRTLANFQSLTKFFYPSIQNSPTRLTCPTRLTRPTLEPVRKVLKV